MRLFAPLLAATAAGPPAVAPPVDKPRVLSGWTQTSAASYDAWPETRTHRGNWATYAFDWTTDYRTTSPDNPFGFPFRVACARSPSRPGRDRVLCPRRTDGHSTHHRTTS